MTDYAANNATISIAARVGKYWGGSTDSIKDDAELQTSGLRQQRCRWPDCPHATRQKPVETFAVARRCRVGLRGGARVMAAVMFDDEVTVANADHQNPGTETAMPWEPAMKPMLHAMPSTTGQSAFRAHTDPLQPAHITSARYSGLKRRSVKSMAQGQKCGGSYTCVLTFEARQIS